MKLMLMKNGRSPFAAASRKLQAGLLKLLVHERNADDAFVRCVHVLAVHFPILMRRFARVAARSRIDAVVQLLLPPGLSSFFMASSIAFFMLSVSAP
jgi:hypothetical protein